MSEPVKPEDMVIVHHSEAGAIAGHRDILFALLARGRHTRVEDMLVTSESGEPGTNPLTIALVHVDDRGMMNAQPGTMTWLNPSGVTHVSPADPEIARGIIGAIDRYALAKAGLTLPGREQAAAAVIPREYQR